MANETHKGKDPAVLFYTKDFLVSTFTLSFEQKGKYITLLCLQHQKGKLTETDLKSVLTDEDWEIAEKFQLAEDGFYYNQRMLDETERRANFISSRRNNGSQGGRPKGTTKKPNGYPNGKPNANLMYKLKETYNKPNENLPGTATVTVNATVTGTENAIENETGNEISNGTRNIIDRALETLIEYDVHPEQYEKALQTVIDVGGLEEALEIMGYEDSVKQKWTNKILEVSKAY
jgi:hypothetical protein